MKIDLTQPTIKVENSKGVSYTGKITNFTFIGSGASIDFMTKDAVCDKHDEHHVIYLSHIWERLGKFLFDNLIDMTGKVDNEFAFFTKKMNYEGKEINYLTGLYKE